jgi:prepilin-type N-terminal cleavage/methylation domain-containing protein
MNKNSQNGFTITELLVTIAILGIFIPVLASFSSSLSTLNDRAQQISDINMTAENKIEALRSAQFTNLAVGGPVDFTAELPASVHLPRSASYTVTSVSSNLKKISMTISYNDHGSTRTLSYATYIGNSGVGQ